MPAKAENAHADDDADMDDDSIVKEIKSTREWHHDIKFIDGEFVEVVVERFQQTGDQALIKKIIDNYEIFRNKWGREFAKCLDGDVEDGEQMHDHVVWRSAMKFLPDKTRKSNGKAFNAYLVSALMNQKKNLFNARMSYKNHPRAQCPICGEHVYHVDEKHLEHRITLKHYKQKFPNYPLVSYDGMTRCPVLGVHVPSAGVSYMNRMFGHYTPDDFWAEFPGARQRGPFACPVTGTRIDRLDDSYASGLGEGYTLDKFLADHPGFPLVKCPFTGKIMSRMTQRHLHEALGQTGRERRYDHDRLSVEYPNVTRAARQVMVRNPYTGAMVPELTPSMLAAAGTTVDKHLREHATMELGQYHYELISCPFTGRKTHVMREKDLEKLGKTTNDFLHAVCAYPLRKFQVMCALDGEWVDNVWSHLASEPHHYAQRTTPEEFERSYGASFSKKTVTTNSFVESESGDSVHVVDLFGPHGTEPDSAMEIEDSLLRAAADEDDVAIARSIRNYHTMDDVYHFASKCHTIRLPRAFSAGDERAAKKAVEEQIGRHDFDFVSAPVPGDKDVSVTSPSRHTIRSKLRRMVEAAGLLA